MRSGVANPSEKWVRVYALIFGEQHREGFVAGVWCHYGLIDFVDE